MTSSMEIQAKYSGVASGNTSPKEEPRMQYTIVSGKHFQELEERVIEKIKEGWEPLGGISDTTHESNERYYDCCAQAMIKPKPWIEAPIAPF